MSKYANPGELRTPVFFVRIERTTDPEGYTTDSEINVFGEGVPVMTKWVNAHGTDAFAAMTLSLREPATVTCRWSPRIRPDCLIYKAGDTDPYEIISLDNVEERNTWLEIKVQRKVAAR